MIDTIKSYEPEEVLIWTNSQSWISEAMPGIFLIF